MFVRDGWEEGLWGNGGGERFGVALRAKGELGGEEIGEEGGVEVVGERYFNRIRRSFDDAASFDDAIATVAVVVVGDFIEDEEGGEIDDEGGGP